MNGAIGFKTATHISAAEYLSKANIKHLLCNILVQMMSSATLKRIGT
jgi:hypothetical protein